jgi:membrane protease YdiL (CAAX protease family)
MNTTSIVKIVLVTIGWLLLTAPGRLMPPSWGVLWLGAIMALFLRAYVWKADRRTAAVLSLRPPPLVVVLLGAVAVTCVQLGFWLLFLSIPAIAGNQSRPPAAPWTSREQMIFMMVDGVLVAPLVEEFGFRGRLIPVLRKRLGVGLAVLGSALIFAVSHLRLLGIPPRLAAGVVYGTARWRGHSVWAAVLLHGIGNAVAMTAMLMQDQMLSAGPSRNPVHDRALAAGLLALATLLVAAIWKVPRRTP